MSLARAFATLRAHRTARFLVVGAYNTAFGYVVFLAVYYGIGDHIHYLIVLLVSYLISVTNAYLLQRRFVFSSQGRRLAEFVRFNVVNLGGMGVNAALLWLAVNHLTPNVAVAQAVALVFTTLFVYAGHSLYSFRMRGGKS